MTSFARALLGILPAWRRLGGHRLPVWGFLKRRGARVERLEALQAGLRCEMCDSKTQCIRRLAAGSDAPMPGCPNLELFQER